MSAMYRIEITDASISRKAGIGMWETVGQPVTVDGLPMVRLGHGTIVSAEGFYESKAEALRAAADKIDVLRLALIEQSERLRAEASSPTKQ